jgi:hypothetical protein
MDNTTKGFAQKIITELESIKRLIVDAISSPQRQHGSSQGNKTQSDSGDNQSSQGIAASSESKPKPPTATNNNADKENKDRFPALAQWKPVLELIGLVFLVGYTTIAAFQWCATREANRIARDQFRQDQRPYVWFAEMGQPEFYNRDQPDPRMGYLVWAWHFTNYGKSPADKLMLTQVVSVGREAIKATPHFPVPKPCAPLPPTKNDFTTAIWEEKISRSRFDELFSTDENIVVRGVFTYRDLSGLPYESRFCFTRLRAGGIEYCNAGKENYIK